jgi:hypothetical protein
MKTKYDALKFEVEEPKEEEVTPRKIGRMKRASQKKIAQLKALIKRRKANALARKQRRGQKLQRRG